MIIQSYMRYYTYKRDSTESIIPKFEFKPARRRSIAILFLYINSLQPHYTVNCRKPDSR